MPRAAHRAFVLRSLIALALFAYLPAGMHAQGRTEAGFTTALSGRAAKAYSGRFGGGVDERIGEWKGFARARAAAVHPEIELLRRVNRHFNAIRAVEDRDHWGAVDYWATPAESVSSAGADCEDFSIAKYYMLKELGVPTYRLRLTYVRAVRLNQAHMVLAYYPRPQDEPLVLDNLDEEVRPASQRSDLVPVYSFNDDEVWMTTGGRAGSPRQIRRWSELLARLDGEMR